MLCADTISFAYTTPDVACVRFGFERMDKFRVRFSCNIAPRTILRQPGTAAGPWHAGPTWYVVQIVCVIAVPMVRHRVYTASGRMVAPKLGVYCMATSYVHMV